MLISNNFTYTKGSTLPRVAPFALFMAFIAIQEGMQYLASNDIVGIPYSWFLYLYPVKTVSVGILLLIFRKSYQEIISRDLARISITVSSVFTGLAVFILWINMDWSWATIGTLKGFDPTILSGEFTYCIIVGFRILGASIIVPVMEELFWRSWLLRFLISHDFQSIPIGSFKWMSFIIGTLMFGLEHNLWLAGIMAGGAYSLLLYSTKSLAQCILAHAVTNFVLGLYILQSGRWELW